MKILEPFAGRMPIRPLLGVTQGHLAESTATLEVAPASSFTCGLSAEDALCRVGSVALGCPCRHLWQSFASAPGSDTCQPPTSTNCSCRLMGGEGRCEIPAWLMHSTESHTFLPSIVCPVARIPSSSPGHHTRL